jgi:hypothetical protein
MFADVYIPADDERRVLIAIKEKPRKLGLRTEGAKVSGRVTRRLLSYGYARVENNLVHPTDKGLEALARCHLPHG